MARRKNRRGLGSFLFAIPMMAVFEGTTTDSGGATPSSGAGGTEGSAAGGGSPPSFSIPDGYELANKTEYGRIKAEHQQFSGWANAAKQHGFNDPNELGQYAPVIAAIKARKTDPSMLAKILSGDPNDGGDPGDAQERPLTRKEIDALFSERDAKAAREQAKREAEAEHKAMYGNRIKAIEETFGSKLQGIPEKLQKLVLAGLRAEHDAARRNIQYPAGHPLASDYFGNLDDKAFGEWTKNYEDLDALFKGMTMEQIGKAAAKGSASVAGNRTSANAKNDGDGHKDKKSTIRDFVKTLPQFAEAGGGV